MALNVKVGLIGKLDMLKFKNMKKVREKAISSAPDKEVKGEFAINVNAKHLHPDYLKLVVKDIKEDPKSNSKYFVLKSEDGKPLPYFRAGQYLSLKMKIGNSQITRAYSLCSSPKKALDGEYEIAIRAVANGFASEELLKNIKVGDELITSSPLGDFYYEDLRDKKTVIALAGGSGITPFLSMAYAIRDGIEDFDLVILYGSNDEESIMLKTELDKVTAECSKVKVVHVLSSEAKSGFESGFITSDLIQKYAPDGEYSVFFCGPDAMLRFVKQEFTKLNIPARLFRSRAIDVTRKVFECEGYPSSSKDMVYQITVKQGDKEYVISANANEPILVALERAGIKAPSRCRNGECGWCRSKCVSGTYFVAKENEHRRWADVENNYIHPCASFATSDMVIEVPGEFY